MSFIGVYYSKIVFVVTIVVVKTKVYFSKSVMSVMLKCSNKQNSILIALQCLYRIKLLTVYRIACFQLSLHIKLANETVF